ncbi:MAG: MerR family transcriptional regulator [Clostridia bacterium]|nr:MerR family transcriptional regulator [Clostridia bacterium]
MKIGQFADTLGIPKATIRYYEAQGLISSSRDANNAYREYTVWDMFGLMDCLRMREYGFSLQESVLLNQKMSLEEILPQYQQRVQKIARETDRLIMLQSHLEQEIKELKLASLNIGRTWFESFDEKIIFPIAYRKASEEYDLKIDDLDAYHIWNTNLSFLKGAVLYSVERQDGKILLKDEIWPLMISRSDFIRLSLPMSDAMSVLPAHTGLCSIVDLGMRGNMSSSIFDPLLREAGSVRLDLLDDQVYGIILRRITTDGILHRYVKLVIPLK